MAVHSIEASIDIPDIDDDAVAFDSQPAGSAHPGEINLGAFRGLAFALAIEATVVGLAGLGWGLWQILR